MMSWAGEEPFIQDKLTFPPTRLHSKLSRSPGWQHTLEYWNWSNKYLGLLLQNIKPKIFLFGMFYQEHTGPIGLILNMATLSHLYGVFTSHFFLWMMISLTNLHQILNSMTDLESWFNSTFKNYTLISVHSYVLISIHSYEAFTSFFGNLRIYLELLENDLKTFRKTLSFHQIHFTMSFLNAELNRYKIWYSGMTDMNVVNNPVHLSRIL